MKKRGFILILVVILLSSLAYAICVDEDEDLYPLYEDADCDPAIFESGVDCDDTDSDVNPGKSETCDSLDNDCNGFIDDGLSGCPEVCGNGVCTDSETYQNCPIDCTESGGSILDCGDGVCDSDTEDEISCPEDCIGEVCGDGTCDASEDLTSCAEDCDVCGDGTCGLSEDETSCAQDCAVLDFGDCNITYAYWRDLADNDINALSEGDTVKLYAEIVNENGLIDDCNNLPLTFIVTEYDPGVQEPEIIDTITGISIQDGAAEVEWEVVYQDDDIDDFELGDLYPEYVLFGAFVDEEILDLSDPEKFIIVYPLGVTPPEEPPINTEFSEDINPPGAADSDDDEDGETTPIDLTECVVDSASWFDSEGTPLDYAIEGDSVNLIAVVTNCDGASLTFLIIEFDGLDETTGDIIGDEIDRVTVTIENGQALSPWTAVYTEDEPDPDTADTYPDYVLFGALFDGEELVTASSPETFFFVYPAGTTPPENVDTSMDQQVDLQEETTPQGTPYESGVGQTGVGMQQRDTGRRTAATSVEDVCGDGTCDVTEDEQSCPEDCVEVGGGLALTIFIIFLFLILAGGGGFFLYRRFKAKQIPPPVKPAAAKPVQPSQPVPQQPVQPQQPVRPAQPAQPVQPPQLKSPFANDQQFKQAVNFIKTAKAQGMTDDKIKQMLKNSNYTQQQIDYAFANLLK